MTTLRIVFQKRDEDKKPMKQKTENCLCILNSSLYTTLTGLVQAEMDWCEVRSKSELADKP